MNKKIPIFIIILTIIGALLHFSNLNWGAPWYFHPDERNIASAVSQLQFPTQMNPHFFAYGSLPLYAIYFLGVVWNLLSCHFCVEATSISFEQTIILSRIFSALFSTLLIPSVYFIGKKLQGETTGIIAAFFTTTSVGLLQFAHFGTFEMWITFLSLWFFSYCSNILNKRKRRDIVIASVLLGALVATKISGIVIAPLLIFALLFSFKDTTKKALFAHLLHFFPTLLVAGSIIIFVYCFTNPYVLFDYLSFQGGIGYESSVAFGTLPVFYTQGFPGTIPIVFQFLHIYPFLANPFLTLLFIPCFLFVLFFGIKNKQKNFLLLVVCFLLLFLSQAFLFAKWTRYIVPTLPFVYLILAIAASWIYKKYKGNPGIYVLFGFVVGIVILFAYAYFVTVTFKPDTRIEAAAWANTHMPHDAKIMSEVYDLGITPFNPYFSNNTLFNFYDLDNHSMEVTKQGLDTLTTNSTYFISPSQRISNTRLTYPNRFPLGNIFYTNLEDKTKYTKVYETPCDILCALISMKPFFTLEETAYVFDRPTIKIYKKIL